MFKQNFESVKYEMFEGQCSIVIGQDGLYDVFINRRCEIQVKKPNSEKSYPYRKENLTYLEYNIATELVRDTLKRFYFYDQIL